MICEDTQIPPPFSIIQAADMTSWDMRTSSSLNKIFQAINQMLSGGYLIFKGESHSFSNKEQQLIPFFITVRGENYRTFIAPPNINSPLKHLEESLKVNRDKIKTAQAKMRDCFETQLSNGIKPELINYYEPTMDVINSHFLIQMLIPMIKKKGGDADFNRPEALFLLTRIELMRNIAEKTVMFNIINMEPSTILKATFFTILVFIFVYVFMLAIR